MPLSQRPILLIQAGDAPGFIRDRSGNFDAMFYAHAGLDKTTCVRVHVQTGERLDEPSAYAAAVITGSHAMVTECLPWSEATAGWLRQAHAAGLPLFGVCYGHQLMAHALGGEVGYHPDGLEAGTRTVTLTEAGENDALTAGLPRRFGANLSHRQTILRLPVGAVALAASAHDAHQIVRYSDTAVSVQFHPEFDAGVMHTYMAYFASEKPDDAGYFAALDKEVRDTPEAAGLLGRFLAMAVERR